MGWSYAYVYKAKDGKETKVFPAMEWLAAMCSHIPNKGEQMVRYYGYYSNVARGKRKEAGTDDVSQLPINDDHLYRDPQYTWNDYIQA